MDKSKEIFNNEMSNLTYKSAIKGKKKFIKKFGDDTQIPYNLKVENNKILYPFIGLKNFVASDEELKIDDKNGVIIGNIRMGFGHYRISMAMASCAHALGYIPYWLDLNSFGDTTGGKLINYQNGLYSMGSRLSQKIGLFNKAIWEPLNSEGFKKLEYNAKDQKNAELMTRVFGQIPKNMPVVATHVWPAQAAVHAGMKRVVNAIPDNWPMALHLAEGAIHTVQTPSSYLGYLTLKGMDGDKVLHNMPIDSIYDVGHYIDHELVSNIDVDCNRRIERLKQNKAKRFLLTIGGAGAQKEIFISIIKRLLPDIEEKKATLYINVGDYLNVWEEIEKAIPEVSKITTKHFDNWTETVEFTKRAFDEEVQGIHAFYHQDIYSAVYATNLLMRTTDVLVTKPSELSFYPIPKLLIKRVGGHEAYGAIRAQEVGDGSLECDTIDLTIQMIDLMMNENTIIEQMCNHIKDANKIGIYNGAYEVIKLAMKKE